MFAIKLCALVTFCVAAQALPVVIEDTDVLGRKLQYDELDRASLSKSKTVGISSRNLGCCPSCEQNRKVRMDAR